MSEQTYVGTELELFAKAVQWKRYYASRISEYIRGDVLEVGAGIGGTTRVLWPAGAESWVCLEPDPDLVATMRSSLDSFAGGPVPQLRVGCVEDLEPGSSFDCVLYIDVFEHIEADRAEMEKAAARLRPGGRLVVLSPAHEFLFSEFDRQIGHFRRYDRRSLGALRPPGLEVEDCFYLDSAGTLLSLANRLMLRASAPTESQILLWDRVVIPVSRVLDRLLAYRVGKTVVAVWRRPAPRSIPAPPGSTNASSSIGVPFS
jgi:SAM-dependent methyltransferase